ncbi:MAG: copper resistance D family protein [Nocardioides sp.]
MTILTPTDGRPSPTVPERTGGHSTTGALLLTLTAVVVGTVAAASLSTTAADPLGSGAQDARVLTAEFAILRALAVLCACGTVGALVVGLVVLPAGAGPTGRSADLGRLTRAAARWALAWTALSVCSAVLLLVQSVETEDGAAAQSVRSLILTAWAAGTVATLTLRGAPRRWGWVALLVSVAALVPAVLDGHAWHADARAAAVVSLFLHVVAVTVWVGGLLALVVHAAPAAQRDPQLLRRFSSVALLAFVVVAATGVVNLMSRLTWAELSASGPYATLVAAKVAAFAIVGAIGLAHRRRTLRAMESGDPRPFVVLVAAEITLLVTIVALGASLSASPGAGPRDSGDHAGACLAVQPRADLSGCRSVETPSRHGGARIGSRIDRDGGL